MHQFTISITVSTLPLSAVLGRADLRVNDSSELLLLLEILHQLDLADVRVCTQPSTGTAKSS